MCNVNVWESQTRASPAMGGNCSLRDTNALASPGTCDLPGVLSSPGVGMREMLMGQDGAGGYHFSFIPRAHKLASTVNLLPDLKGLCGLHVPLCCKQAMRGCLRIGHLPVLILYSTRQGSPSASLPPFYKVTMAI